MITLVRHGPSRYVGPFLISDAEVVRWMQEHDKAGISRRAPPPRDLVRMAESASCIAVSDLPRSFDSALRLVPDAHPIVDPVFREVDIPLRIPLPLRMRPWRWLELAHIAWLLNWHSGGETRRVASLRASAAADRLVAHADRHGDVMLVGHGSLNWLIAWELLRRGWSGRWVPHHRHWGASTYVRWGGGG